MNEKTCGNCRHLGKQMYKVDKNGDEVATVFHMCDKIEHSREAGALEKRAHVTDASGYFAALCVRTDFGCIEWEAKDDQNV